MTSTPACEQQLPVFKCLSAARHILQSSLFVSAVNNERSLRRNGGKESRERRVGWQTGGDKSGNWKISGEGKDEEEEQEESRAEEIGFFLQLINLDNREHHVSERSGRHGSLGSLWPVVKRSPYHTSTNTHVTTNWWIKTHTQTLSRVSLSWASECVQQFYFHVEVSSLVTIVALAVIIS